MLNPCRPIAILASSAGLALAPVAIAASCSAKHSEYLPAARALPPTVTPGPSATCISWASAFAASNFSRVISGISELPAEG